MYLLVSLCGTLGGCVVLFVLLLVVLNHRASLIFGIYPCKDLFYHLKYVIALGVVRYLRHRIYHQKRHQLESPAFLEQLDRAQLLSEGMQSYDVVSLMAANERGEKLLVTFERWRRGINQVCLYLWLPQHGLLSSPKLPDMMYFSTDGNEESTEFKGHGFHIYPRECMRRWCIRYEGELKHSAQERLVPVKLHLEFQSSQDYFNYNRDLSGAVIADSIAREPWNKQFYAMLRNIEQTLEKRIHYEQNGHLTGQLEIGGGNDDLSTPIIPLTMRGFRDHSFGIERCLSTINRYVYFGLFLNDGTNLIVGVLSQPSFFLSSLKVGYVCTRDGLYRPITECNFELYSYGEKGTPPKHQNFMVHTRDAKYFVQIHVDDTAVRYMGNDWESKIFTQFVGCTVNGVPGQGLAEYLYRSPVRRPLTVSAQDPAWYRASAERCSKYEAK